MTLDEYIQKLQELKQKHGGDLPVITECGGMLVIWVGLVKEPYVTNLLPDGDEYDSNISPSENYVVV